MSSGEKQAERLPVTTGSIITESKGTFMGLDGMAFVYVVLAFAFTNFFFGLVPQFQKFAFPASVVVSCMVFGILLYYVRGKPDGFLADVMVYNFRPKRFEHRPREKRLTLIKE